MKIKNLGFTAFFSGISLLGVVFSTLTLYSKNSSIDYNIFINYFIFTSVFSGILVLYTIVLNFSILKKEEVDRNIKKVLSIIYVISILYFSTIVLRQYFNGKIIETIVLSCLLITAVSFMICGGYLYKSQKNNK